MSDSVEASEQTGNGRAASRPDRRIRPYRASDRPAVRRLCCETGFLGNPIDPVFEDRELFADFLTGYYTDREPESSLVLEQDGEVVGYLLGCRHPGRQRRHDRRRVIPLAARVLIRLPRYGPESRRYLGWLAVRGWRESPPAPRDVPHFHINLLPGARDVPSTRLLIDAFLGYLRSRGETSVYGQMVTVGNRRGTRMFERYGFRVLNKSEVTKYRRVHPGPVYLCTVLKDLRENDGLYGSRPSTARVTPATPTPAAPR